MTRMPSLCAFCAAVLFSLLLVGSSQCDAAVDERPETSEHSAEDHASLGKELPLWTVVPFAALLLCIAILPLAAPHWWEHNTNKGIVAGALALLIAAYLAIVHQTH